MHSNIPLFTEILTFSFDVFSDSLGEFGRFSDKFPYSNLFPGFTGGEDWCSRLGISESEFFSSGIVFACL